MMVRSKGIATHAVRKQIRRTLEAWFDGPLHSLLVRNGFILAIEAAGPQDRLQMFRSRVRQVEVVGCRIGQRIGTEETEFCAEMGVFLRGVPHFSGAKFSGVAGLPLKSTLDCHFRQSLHPSRTLIPSPSRRTTWILKSAGSNVDGCLSDVLRKIESVGMPWFERFGDPRRTYEAVVEKTRIGTKLSGDWGHVYGETLVKGFLGLEFGDWPTAVANLEAALALANPRHSLDASQPQRLYHQVELEIEAALATARAGMNEEPYGVTMGRWTFDFELHEEGKL